MFLMPTQYFLTDQLLCSSSTCYMKSNSMADNLKKKILLKTSNVNQ